MPWRRERWTVIALRSIPAFMVAFPPFSVYNFLWFCDMYSTPIAYFLTFTVRGSWRHGDSRGSWKRNGQFVALRSNIETAPNKNPPHYFNEDERRIVENALDEVCAERQWTLHEKSIMSNHVHIIVTAPETSPEHVMKLLKAKATMRLRKGGFVGAEEKIWTQHGSTKYLFDEESLQTVREYVHAHQTPEHQTAKQ